MTATRITIESPRDNLRRVLDGLDHVPLNAATPQAVRAAVIAAKREAWLALETEDKATR